MSDPQFVQTPGGVIQIQHLNTTQWVKRSSITAVGMNEYGVWFISGGVTLYADQDYFTMLMTLMEDNR